MKYIFLCVWLCTRVVTFKAGYGCPTNPCAELGARSNPPYGGHLRTAGSFPAREQFSLPDAHHGLSRHTGVLKAEATEIQAQRDRDDIAAGGTRCRNQTAVHSDTDSVPRAVHGRRPAARR